jgi:hypothetical protein
LPRVNWEREEGAVTAERFGPPRLNTQLVVSSN